MSALSVMSLKVPRESENTPEQTAQLLSSLAKATKFPGLLSKLTGGKPIHLSLEVTVSGGQVTFAVVFPKHLLAFVQSQFLATYQDAVMKEIPDYTSWMKEDLIGDRVHLGLVRQSYAPYFPLRDYADYKEVDPMLPLLGVLSKANEEDHILIQFVLTPAPSKFHKQAYKYLHPKARVDDSGKTEKSGQPEGKKLIEDKLSQPAVGVSIHLAVSRPELLHDLYGALSVLNRPDGNMLTTGRIVPWEKKKLFNCIIHRHHFRSLWTPMPILNVMELSSLWHLPGVYTKIPNIDWAASSSFAEPPANLPVHQKFAGEEGTTLDPNKDINFFAKAIFRNQEAIFGLKLEDRLRHVYILGKSGTGKSTLLENMAVDDFKKGRGVAFIDPHGDACENLLNYIPKSRINDTIYFNPADRDFPISLNILEVDNPDQAELVASSIVAIFHKLYGNSWGPRLEYILRNTLLTLTQVPGSTLPDVIRMLTDSSFRKKVYPKLTNAQILSFWQKEFDPLEEKTRLEHISPILNKVGQFVNSPLIHSLISRQKSTVRLEDVMNSGKILIANLSQGKLGEDNATLLGAMLITKLQLAAMARVDMPKDQRKEFFLYVDEFQNFATESFIKILSEARKFRLGLILANQYMAQIPEEIQKAIFGNAGTTISFVVGSEDGKIMEAEYAGTFTQAALVSLQKHQIAMRMTIDNSLSLPFMATTLPPHKSTNQNKEKVLTESRKRYSYQLSKTKPEPSVSPDQSTSQSQPEASGS